MSQSRSARCCSKVVTFSAYVKHKNTPQFSCRNLPITVLRNVSNCYKNTLRYIVHRASFLVASRSKANHAFGNTGTNSFFLGVGTVRSRVH